MLTFTQVSASPATSAVAPVTVAAAAAPVAVAAAAAPVWERDPATVEALAAPAGRTRRDTSPNGGDLIGWKIKGGL